MKNMKVSLMDFNHKLAIGLLRMADDKQMSNMLYLETSILNTRCIGKKYGSIPDDLGFARNPQTLQERIEDIEWPLRFRLKHFTENETLVELRLTHDDLFQHSIQKLAYNHGKNHCVFCYKGQTSYGCTLCKVLLCRHCRKGGPDEKSCFEIWHSSIYLIEARQKFDETHSRKATGKKDGRTSIQKSTASKIDFKNEVRKKVAKRKRTTPSPDVSPTMRTRSRKSKLDRTASEKNKTSTSGSNSRSEEDSVEGLFDTPAQRTRSKERFKSVSPAQNTRSRGRNNDLTQTRIEKSTPTVQSPVPRQRNLRRSTVGSPVTRQRNQRRREDQHIPNEADTPTVTLHQETSSSMKGSEVKQTPSPGNTPEQEANDSGTNNEVQETAMVATNVEHERPLQDTPAQGSHQQEVVVKSVTSPAILSLQEQYGSDATTDTE